MGTGPNLSLQKKKKKRMKCRSETIFISTLQTITIMMGVPYKNSSLQLCHHICLSYDAVPLKSCNFMSGNWCLGGVLSFHNNLFLTTWRILKEDTVSVPAG